MRVVCLQPTRDPVLCGDGPIRIGSAANDEVVVDGAGAAPHHVSIVADARGLVLTVAPGCRRVHVNARAVRERALLRYGDTITLGDNRLLLTSDESPARRVVPRSDAARESSEPVLLRIVAGRDSGLALSVSPQLHLGAGTRHFGELRFSCKVELTAEGLVLESDSGQPRVNGWACRHASLACDDQITVGEHWLVVEAPALQYAAHIASLPPPPAADGDAPENVGPSRAGTWGLIAAAAVLALIIAVVLYFHG